MIKTLLQVERELIIGAMSECRDVKTKAAKAIGVSRACFFRKLKKHNLVRENAFGRLPFKKEVL